MKNNDLIAAAVCAQYTPEQLHKLAAHYYTAVAWDSSNPVTLYPYIRGYRGDGWDNACDYLTLSAVRARLARGTLIFS